MKYLVAAFLALCVPCSADDLQLRDGRRISWKTLTDNGDSYSIETREGQTVKVRKSDVERFLLPKEAQPAPPLTGASFVLDSKKVSTINLLAKPDSIRSTPDGSWKLTGGILTGQAVFPVWSGASFDVDLTDEYDLTITAERVGPGDKTFVVGLVTPVGSCGWHFDAWGATASCLTVLGGQEGEHVSGQVFKSGKPRTVKFSVRKDALLVTLDGKELWKGRVSWAVATVHPSVPMKDRGRLFLAAEGGSWKVSSFTMTSAK
jgi:hypothetical protein